MSFAKIQRRIRRLRKQLTREEQFSQYRGDPVGYIRDVLKQELWHKQIEICNKLLTPPHKVLVKSCHKVGKCPAFDEIITLANGKRVRAEHLVGKEFELLTIHDGQHIPVKARAEWNGVEPVYQVVTETGKKIKRTGNHPLYSLGGWAEAKDLAVGQKVACPLELLGKRNAPYLPDTFNAPDGMHWEKITSILLLPPCPTVAIEVPHYHTYITQFYEHNSMLSACLISWFFDCYNPSLVISTAPTDKAVKEQLWRQVRIFRANAKLGGFRGPAAPELWANHDHWASGFTAKSGEAFQGRHQEHMFFIIDEAVGVQPWVFDVMKSMFKGEGKHFWLCIGNPTDTSSQMYSEEFTRDLDGNPSWNVVEMSALDHPNIEAGLLEQAEPFPAAVSLTQFKTWLSDWCDEIPEQEAGLTDLLFPPLHICAEKYQQANGTEPQNEESLIEWAMQNAGLKFYRPGPNMEARALGRWPSSGTYGVWSDMAWQLVQNGNLEWPHAGVIPEIGCDGARFGDDYSSFHVRCGNISLHHERHNGWDTVQVAGQLKKLAREYAGWWNERRERGRAPLKPQQIPIKIDEGGVVGIVDQKDDYRFIGVSSASTAAEPEKYPNKRSELWFVTARRAKNGELSLAEIRDQKLLTLIRQQAMAPTWKMNGKGQQVVEDKAETKKRLGFSPDDMDAINLAYYGGGGWEAPTVITDSQIEKRVLFRRGRK